MKALAGLLLAAAVCSPSVTVAAATELDEAKCSALANQQIPAAQIGLPTTGAVVTGAQMFAATEAVSRHCLVSGSVKPVDAKAPNIEFRIALPKAWNTKVVMLGGGGFNGTIPPVTGGSYNAGTAAPSPLARGYAVFGSDSGHQMPVTEAGSFLTNDEAYWNFIGNALKKTRDVARAVILAAYGEAPTKAYFIGGSTGGREALMVAGRWPDDWNGIVSLYPAREQMTQLLGGLNVNRAWAAPGAWLNQDERAALFNAARAACDGFDGATDGVISDVKRCNATFDPKSLRCAGGADTSDKCLSDAQLRGLDTMHRPLEFNFSLASGAKKFPGYNIYTSDSGIPSKLSQQAMVSWLALGSTPPAFPMTEQMTLSAQYGDNFLRYGVARDTSFNPLTFDSANPGPFASRLSEWSALDSSDRDLTPFAARGGKVLIMDGTEDLIVSPRMTETYYEALKSKMGEAAVAGFLRFYEVPGFGHSVSTNFNAVWDYLTALEHWVENGVDPAEHEVVTDTVGVPGRTRPLCLYPKWPKYKGSGDVNVAASFECAV